MDSERHTDSMGDLFEELAPQQTQRLTDRTARAFVRALDQYVSVGGVVALNLDELSRIVTFVIDRPELFRPILIASMDQERYAGR